MHDHLSAPAGPLVLNEVSCRGEEFAELINIGSATVDLREFALADRNDPAVAAPLSGSLAPGARVSFQLPGLACEDEEAVLFRNDKTVDWVRAPLSPADASYARLPDGSGSFARAAATPGKPNVAYMDQASRLFLPLEQPVPSTLPQLRIRLGANEAAGLRGVTAESPREWVEASVTFEDSDGRVGPLSTGLRLKGQSVFRDLSGKAAFRLDFDRFETGGHLFGIEKLTLNNFVQDSSAAHERLYYGLVARQKLAGPRTGYVEVWVNDQPYGVYLALESTDEEAFLGRVFPSSALLYEGEYGADLYVGKDPDFDEDYGDDPERVALRHVIDVFNAAQDESVLEDTATVIAWDRVIPQLAVDMFCGHYDSYTGNRNNYTFHIDDDGRLSVIPGGADQTFGEVFQRDTDGGLMLMRCLRNDACTDRLDVAVAAVAEDANDFFKRGGAQQLRNSATRLLARFTEDTRTEWDQRNLPAQVDQMIEFVQRSIANPP